MLPLELPSNTIYYIIISNNYHHHHHHHYYYYYSGETYVIDGYAYNTDPSQPGQLKVHFNSGGAPFDAAYWVLSLGPIVNDQYEYAVVSDNLSQFLFILARDVNTFKSTYETEVLAFVQSIGFTGYKAPIATYQATDCVYESAARQNYIKSHPN